MSDIVSKPANRAYREGWERTFRASDEELAEEARAWDSGEIKPTDCDWEDAPEACPAPACSGLVDVDVFKYPGLPVRLPEAVYEFVKLRIAYDELAKKSGMAAADVQFRKSIDIHFHAMTHEEQALADSVLRRR